MAKGVGLDSGEFEVKVVELDGSYRKPRLTKVSVDRVRPHSTQTSNPDHAESEAQALRHALKAAQISKQNVTLGFPSREALFRQMMVPFTGQERIRKVIKFEAEGEIHSQSVDDMVIDFRVVEELEDETRVLVAGVPKATLRLTLDSLSAAGIEPENVDLDCMGLFRVATWAGAFGEAAKQAAEEEVDGEEGSDVPAPTIVAGESSRVVLNVGARSTLVLVVTGDHLADMRAIPLGCDSIAEELVSHFDIGLEEAREALIHCLATGTDLDVSRLAAVEEADADPAAEPVAEPVEGAEATATPVAQIVVDAASVQDARDRFLKRLRREFMRFIVSVRGMERTSAAFVCGGGAALPGINPMLAEVFGVEPQPLRILHLLNHNLEEDEARELEPRIAVAVGLALGSLGGGVKGFNFRQEELAYTHGFDRVKLPLALACMLLLFFLFFHGVGLRNELKAKKQIYGSPELKKSAAGANRRQVGGKVTNYVQYSGYLNYLVNDGTWPEQNLPHNEYRKMVNDMAKVPTFNRMNWYKNQLRKMLEEVQKEGQYDPSLTLDSGTAVLQQFAEIIQSVEKQLGRFYVGTISLRLPAKGNRSFGFKIFFRGDQFRERNGILQGAFEAAFRKADSPFEKFTKTATENPVSGDSGSGCYYDYSITLRPSVPLRKL